MQSVAMTSMTVFTAAVQAFQSWIASGTALRGRLIGPIML
jgi:hypothetical protein